MSFLKALASILVIAYGACSSFARKTNVPPERPNILWIVADDLGADIAPYGTPLVQTPHIDRLASDGIFYANMFSVAAVCSPSRSALVTGMYPVSINSHQHRTRTKATLPAGVLPISEYFRRYGYYVSNGSSENPAWRGKTDYNFAHDPRQLYDGASWEQRKPGQPFFAQIQIKYPHRPFTPDTIHPIDPDQVSIPPYYPNTPLARKDWAMYLETIQLTDRHVGQVLDRLAADGLLDNTIIFFFGDQGSPHVRSKQFLYDGGIRTPLIVRFPDRHGAGKANTRIVSTVDLAATSLALAGIPIPESMQGVDFLDSTLPPRTYAFSMRDRCDETVDRIRSVRSHRFKYIRNFYPQRPYTQFNTYKKTSYPMLAEMEVLHRQGLLNDVQRQFMANTRPPEELYDVLSDPHEMHNLAASSQFQDTLAHYRTVLDHWLLEADHGVYPEPADEITHAEKLMEENYRKEMEQRGLDPAISDDGLLNYWRSLLLR